MLPRGRRDVAESGAKKSPFRALESQKPRSLGRQKGQTCTRLEFGRLFVDGAPQPGNLAGRPSRGCSREERWGGGNGSLGAGGFYTPAPASVEWGLPQVGGGGEDENPR